MDLNEQWVLLVLSHHLLENVPITSIQGLLHLLQDVLFLLRDVDSEDPVLELVHEAAVRNQAVECSEV